MSEHELALVLPWGLGVSGGSAGLNDISWFTCPTCGATVSERVVGLRYGAANRLHHEAWHEGLAITEEDQ